VGCTFPRPGRSTLRALLRPGDAARRICSHRVGRTSDNMVRMSEPHSIEDLLATIDAEISWASEQDRFAGFTSWAVGGAIVLLLNAAGSVWESGALRLPNVAAMFLVMILASDMVATLVGRGAAPQSAIRVPFRLWSHPSWAAVALQTLLLIIAIYLNSAVSKWATVAAVVTFGMGALTYASFQPAIAVRMSQTNSLKKVWSRRADAPYTAGVKFALFIAEWLRLVLYTLLIVVYAGAAYDLRPGQSIRDLRLAAIATLIVALLGIAMRGNMTPRLEGLKHLRRAVSLEQLSITDARHAFEALQLGIYDAAGIVTVCRSAIKAVSNFRSEIEQKSADSTAPPNVNHDNRARYSYSELGDKVRNAWTFVSAELALYQVISPGGAAALATVIAELEEQYVALTALGTRAFAGSKCDRAA